MSDTSDPLSEALAGLMPAATAIEKALYGLGEPIDPAGGPERLQHANAALRVILAAVGKTVPELHPLDGPAQDAADVMASRLESLAHIVRNAPTIFARNVKALAFAGHQDPTRPLLRHADFKTPLLVTPPGATFPAMPGDPNAIAAGLIEELPADHIGRKLAGPAEWFNGVDGPCLILGKVGDQVYEPQAVRRLTREWRHTKDNERVQWDREEAERRGDEERRLRIMHREDMLAGRV